MIEYHGSLETELKLGINIADIPLLTQQSLLKEYCKEGPIVQHLTSYYYDTPDLCLRQHKLSLRVRRRDDCWIQTVKRGGSVVNGLHQRKEWQCQLAAAEPDLTHAVLPPQLLQLLQKQPKIVQEIQPMFHTEFERTVWNLEWEDGVKIEFVLDRGKIRKDHANVPICEVECELNQGSVEQLMRFVKQLQLNVPLTPMNESKASRGYALVREAD